MISLGELQSWDLNPGPLIPNPVLCPLFRLDDDHSFPQTIPQGSVGDPGVEPNDVLP